ncbi:alpha/beta fold hydrolase [uncultured Sphingomonas sp.]|uniref:alpha/beta fold hydrolase n=1 Tax=uncultured Sphingomonas sp. TaxID=158754 RepID=UPI0035CC9753
MIISFVGTAGGELAVEVAGDGPLIICSPALGDTRDAFAPLAAHLAACGYRVARVDLRGHGDSSVGFDRYGDEAIADDFLTLIDVLGRGEPAILAGASLSAGAAVIAAGRRPDQVAGLVLLGPFLRNGMGDAMLRVLRAAFMRPWGPFVWRAYAAKLWPGLGAKAGERAAASTVSLTRPGRWPAFRATFAGADHRAVAPWIDRVRAPVLVVMGEADPDWKNPRDEAEWVASNFADVELIMVPDAGHAPMFERPAVVNPAVARFLTKIGIDKASARAHA